MSFTLKLNEGAEISAVRLAAYIKMFRYEMSTAEALMHARVLIGGGDMEIAYLPYGFSDIAAPWTVIEHRSPIALEFDERWSKYNLGEKLAELGAEGDAESAIEFCKMFLAGDMANFCMG